ncbi:MAG: phage tail length tape measure family protein [Bauldia sp.]|nr:phage tail length tape measure family protein [Bauldia sp.]
MANETVETAIYKLGYRADGKEQVDALRGSVENLTASTEKQEVSQQKITRATRTTTGEFNRMMARLDPRIRAEQALQRALEQTDRLLEEGVISAGQAATAIKAATTKYDAAVAQMDRAKRLQDSFMGAADAAKLSAFQMQNMSFQLQDIGQAIATGQPMFRTFIQQGSQLAQLFGPGVGLSGALKAVGAGIVQFVTNPLNIAVLVFASAVAGAQALMKAFGGGETAAERAATANDLLADSIRRVTDGYEAASRRIVDLGQDVTEGAIRQLTLELEAAQEAFRQLFSSSRLEGAVNQSLLWSGISADEILQLDAIMQRLVASVEAGRPAIAAFQNEMAILANQASPALASIADALAAITREVFGEGDEAISLEEIAANIAVAIAALSELQGGVAPGTEAGGLGRSLEEATAALREMVPALAEADERTRALAEADLAYADAARQLGAQVLADALTYDEASERAWELREVLALAKQEINGTADAFRDATEGAEDFIAAALGPKLTGLDAELAKIQEEAGALRDALTALSEANLLPDQQAIVESLLRVLDQSEQAALDAARATHEQARALQEAETKANAFNAAMAQLEGIAVGALSASAQAANALVVAIANATDQTGRLAAMMAYLRGQAALGVGGVQEAIANMASQIVPPTLSDRLTFVRNQYVGLTDAQIDAMEANDELAQAFYEQAGALYDSIQASAEYRASLVGGGGGGGGAGGGLTDAFAKATEAAEKQIESLRQQAEVFGLTAEEAARFRFEQELLTAAMADGTVTEAETARIAELTAGYDEAATELARLNAEKAKSARMTEVFGNVVDGIMSMVRGAEDGLDLLIKAVDNASKKLAEYAKTQFAAGNIGRAALGLVGGIITSIIGRILEARREMRAAQEAWADAQDEITALAAEINGSAPGALGQSIAGMRDRIARLIEVAQKAGQPIDDLQRMMTDFAVRAIGDFQRTFGLMVHGLRSGLGPNSPAVEAAASVADLGKQLAAFIADTKLAVEATGSSQEALRVATAAAQDYALSLLGQPPVLSEVQTEYLRIMGTAQALTGVLIDLGMSAEEAAAAIEDGVAEALDALSSKFEKDIRAKLNAALGKGYINDIGALIEEAQSLLADAELLGVDQAKVLQFFAAEAQNIVNGAGLTGDALDELIALFPELAGVVTDAADVIQAQMDRINDVAKTILDYVNGLLTGPGSTLSPSDRLVAAQAQYEAQLALAQAGDIDAQAGISQYAEAYRDAGRTMFASSPAFQAIFDKIVNDLMSLPAVQQADDPVVVALRETTEQLLGIQAQQIAATNDVETTTASVKLTADKLGKTTEQINTNLAAEYWSPMVQSLAAIEEYTRITANTKEIKHPILHKLFPKLFSAEGGLIPMYAGGGLIGNGIWNEDSVLARYAGGGTVGLAGGEYVVPAPAVNANTLPVLEAMRRGGGVNDNRRELLELTRVTSDIGAAQIREMRAGFGALAQRIEALETRTRIEASREPRRASNR